MIPDLDIYRSANLLVNQRDHQPVMLAGAELPQRNSPQHLVPDQRATAQKWRVS